MNARARDTNPWLDFDAGPDIGENPTIPDVPAGMRVGEHEFEAAPGLPERLPAGERVLWQGAPRWQSLAMRAFHAGKLTVYFAVLLALRAGNALWDGASWAQAAVAALWLLPVAIAAVGLLVLIAWLASRTTLYTITNSRVVMRIGIVLTITFNLPFRSIESAGLRQYGNGTGDIPLALLGPDRIAYLHLWPHVRPWRIGQPEPMLRAVPDAARAAEILSRALAASAGNATKSAAVGSVDSLQPISQRHPLAAAGR